MAKTAIKTPEELKKDKRTGVLTVVVIALLILIFAVGFIYGLKSVLAMEGAFPPVELTASKTVLYDTNESSEAEKASMTKEQITDYLTKVINLALTNEAKIKTGIDCGIKKEKDESGSKQYALSTTGSDGLLTTLRLLADDMGDDDTRFGKDMTKDYESQSTDFGEDMSDILSIPAISAEDITDFTCTYIYYRCPTCDETGEDDGSIRYDVCPLCGSTYGYNIQYRDEYTVTLHLNVTDEVLNRNFSPRSEAEIRYLIGDELDGIAEVSDIKTVYTGLTVTFKVNRETDHLTYIAYRKDADVSLNAAFEGEWENIGEQDIAFSYYRIDSCSLTWPGITLNEHELTIEPKDSDNLLATLTCSQPTEMTVLWESDNPDAVTVDEEGYLKAAKTDGGEALITASYEFNGKTYRDSCKVYVRYPVESTSVNKSKAKLNPGETLALKLTFSPKKATVQTVTWYSEDESVATVDENGVVTAVGVGSTSVYSLTDDGYFKSSCKITVE